MKANSITKAVIATVSAVSILTLSPASYADGSKRIHVSDKKLGIDFVPLDVAKSKPAYRVEESIHFSVTGYGRNYYLYVFGYDKDTNRLKVLLPDENTKSNYMFANTEYHIPNSIDFYSDEVGQERFVFVGTRRYFDVNNPTELARLRRAVSNGNSDGTKAIRTRNHHAVSVNVFIN